MRTHAVTPAIVAAVLAVAAAGCGGSSSSSSQAPGTASSSKSSASSATSSSAATTTSGATTATGNGAVRTGAVRVTLVGENHSPKVGQEWRYTVRAADASGRPLTGTVETEFALGGQVVGRETPATHTLRHGVLHDSVQFPAQAVGYPLALRAVVRSTAGTVAVDWRVTVSR